MKSQPQLDGEARCLSVNFGVGEILVVHRTGDELFTRRAQRLPDMAQLVVGGVKPPRRKHYNYNSFALVDGQTIAAQKGKKSGHANYKLFYSGTRISS